MKIKLLSFCLMVLLGGLSVQASVFDETACYRALFRMLASSMDENGNGDIISSDIGKPDFVRQMWNLNELPSDEATCWWSDDGIQELNTASWNENLISSKYMFYRLRNGISKANLYLENVPEDMGLHRAEVRFLRALFYFHALDLFGNVPLMTSTSVNLFTSFSDYSMGAGISTETMTAEEYEFLYQAYADNTIERPKQVGCNALFDFIVSELKACEKDLPAPGSEEYARPSKAAVWMLLARLYLNASVYTGTVRWDEAKTYAKKVVDSKAYSLCPNFHYLFMGDNDTNGAQREFIFPIYVDGEQVQTWGCTTFLIAATYDSEMGFDIGSGLNQFWSGCCARRALVEKFDLTKDDRAQFYTYGHSLNISSLTNGFHQGYAVTKYTNAYSDGSSFGGTFASTDFPLMRLAEAYLTYAEADAHQHGGTCTEEGADMLNQVRTRSHIGELSTVTISDIADEWAREFMFEGRRRSDLVRLGLFTGSEYLWDWKGGAKNGKAIDSHCSRYAIPNEIMYLSEDYVQNEGYMDINKVKLAESFTLDTPDFASQVVSLWDVETMNFTWEIPEIENADASELSYSLQMSPTGKFDKAQNYDESIGMGDATYYSFSTSDVRCETLDMVLLTWKRVKRWSDSSKQPLDIYFRCVATIGNKVSVSNVVKVTVLPYVNNLNSTNFYLIGSGIGDGKQVLTKEGIGTSMLPMDIDYEHYSRGWGYQGGGIYKLTTWLEKNSPFWIRQISSKSYGSSYYCTSDGTIEHARKNQWGDGDVPGEDQMFTVGESGMYEIVLNTYPDWEQDENGEWHQLPFLTVTKKEDSAGGVQSVIKRKEVAGGISSVNIAGDAEATLKQTAAGHIWYGHLSMEQEGRAHFVVAGQPCGDEGFSFGYAKPGDAELTVPAGNYIVTYNAATGFYDFYDTDDERSLNSLTMYEKPKKPEPVVFANYYLIGALNNWQLNDDYPFTTEDGVNYHLVVPAPAKESSGNFMIASEDAIKDSDWDQLFLTAPYAGCDELEGYFYSVIGGDKNTWNLPMLSDGNTHYDLLLDMNSYTFKFTPCTPAGIYTVTRDSKASSVVYTLDGVRVRSDVRQLPKGIYIVNGKKIVVR